MTVKDEDFATANKDDHMQRMWSEQTLKIFKECVDTYLKILQPKSNKGTLKINEEIKLLKNIKITIRNTLKRSDGSFTDLSMSFGDYQLLSDILWKNWAALNQILRSRRENVTVEGELEKEEAHLESLTDILKLPLFEKIPRRKTLVDNFVAGFDSGVVVSKPAIQQPNSQIERVKKTELFDKYDLHPEIKRVAFNEFQDGYYKISIQNAFVEVIDQVKKKTGHPSKKTQKGKVRDLDGDELMQHVFGCDGEQKPLIKFNKLSSSLERAEQRGIMNLFKGIVGIRDRKTHVNYIQNDPVKTIEYLSLASLLLRLLDENKIAKS